MAGRDCQYSPLEYMFVIFFSGSHVVLRGGVSFFCILVLYLRL